MSNGTQEGVEVVQAKVKGRHLKVVQLGNRAGWPMSMQVDIENIDVGDKITDVEVAVDRETGYARFVGRSGRQTDAVVVIVRTRGEGPPVREGDTEAVAGDPQRILYGRGKVEEVRFFDSMWELLPGDALEVRFADGRQTFIAVDHQETVWTGLRALNIAGRYFQAPR